MDGSPPPLPALARRSGHLWAAGAFASFLLAYYVAYHYAMAFSQASASPFWFPDSVLLCALLLSPPSRWWIFITATLPIRLFAPVSAGIPDWFLLATWAIDSAKGLVAAALLRRLNRNPTRLETMHDFLVFCLVAVVAVPTLAALVGAWARSLLGYPFWPAWERWLMGNVLTHLVVTPAILYWLVAPWRVPAMDRARWTEAVVLVAGLVVSGYLAFSTGANGMGLSEPLFYAPVPFMFWAAIRFGMMGASGAVIIVSILCVGAALGGRGPYSDLSHADMALALQHFLLLRAAPLYLVAILIEQNAAVERSLREREAEAHRQRIELAHAGRISTMGQLATSIAHELYQPLGAILQNAEAAELVLGRRPLDERELRVILADIQRDDRLAAAVIGRMRSMLGTREMAFEALPVRQLLDEAHTLVRAEMRARGVTLELDFAPDLPPARGDRVHLLQVLLNLFVNGADAMHGRAAGERHLGMAARRVDERTLEVAVSDTGYGVPAEHLTRVFDPFFTTKPHGMGMGLAISKAIVESHGGRIWAERNARGGATFCFTLPTAGAGMGVPA